MPTLEELQRHTALVGWFTDRTNGNYALSKSDLKDMQLQLQKNTTKCIF